MATENRHIERIANTRANLQTNLDNMQIAIETDQNENLVYKDDDGTYHIIPNLGDDVNFGNVLIDGYAGYDADNMIKMTAVLTYIKANGYKILEYLHSNGYICVNSENADIDFEVSGTGGVTAPIIHCDAGNNRLGVGTTTPAEKVDIVSVGGTNLRIGGIAVGDYGRILFHGNRDIAGRTIGSILAYQNSTGSPVLVSEIRQQRVGSTTDNKAAVEIFTHDGTNLLSAIYISHEQKVGIGTTTPATLTEIQGGLTTVGAVLTLSTKEPTVVANDVLGDIDFKAPLSTAGSDSVLVAASITAVAEDTFSTTVNKTSLEFRTGASEAATTKMTIKSDGKVGIGTTTPAEKLDIVGNIKASGNISAMRKIAAVGALNTFQFDGDTPASLTQYMEMDLPTNSNSHAAEAGKAVFTVRYYEVAGPKSAAYRIDVAWMKTTTGANAYVITNVKTGEATVTPPDISEAFSIVSGKLRLTITAAFGAGEEGTAWVNGQIVEFTDWEVHTY